MKRDRNHEDDFPADLISGDEAIDLVIDAVLIGSKPLRRMTRRILRVERKLRKAVDDDAWHVFLKLEELLNERASKHADILIRWGLGHGSRSRR